MNRKEFVITSDAGHNIVKYAWNAALRRVEDIARKLAKDERTTYTLTNKVSHKDTFGNFEHGIRTWSSASGKNVTFKIERIK